MKGSLDEKQLAKLLKEGAHVDGTDVVSLIPCHGTTSIHECHGGDLRQGEWECGMKGGHMGEHRR